tara:strand:- start:2861 stop:3187 length:327 start_codon:yes stop_codon:yes gene_type:complete
MKVSFKKLFKRDKNKLVLDGKKFKKDHNVERDWVLLIFFFVILLIIVSFLGYRDYESFVLRTDETIGGEEQRSINETRLNNVIETINEREDVFTRYASTTTDLIDPSR